jgi:cell wall-associated NlpC family hydrolase
VIPSRSDLRAGDLVFFRSDAGVIHHVGVYSGDGEMIHSPRTGSTVEVTSIYSEPYFSEFAGGRRYATAVS